MAPLALAFRAAGHEVAVATDPGFAPHVRAVGFEAFPAGLDMPVAMAKLYRTVRNWREITPWDQAPHIWRGVFGGVRIEPMLADLEPLIAAWGPDLLIHDSAELAGAIAAEVAGIAHAEHAFGVLRPLALREAGTEGVEAACRRRGVANPGVGGLGGELYLDPCPPGIQDPDIVALANVQPIRPVGFDEAPDAVIPAWLDEPRHRPLVYVTLGTEFNKRADVYRTVLDGIAGEPWDVVVTIGLRGERALLEPQPDNVHIERWVPQSRLLPHAAAFVSHGGSGAMLGTIGAAVPMLAVPQGADQFINADRILATGMGRRLLPAELEPSAVRDAVRALVDDPAYRAAAHGVRATTTTMPPPESVVPILERYAARGG
jgi:UDP:flavonoid glycosyltransferase YjiC (YdhE family)